MLQSFETVAKIAQMVSNDKDDLETCHFILNCIRKILVDPNSFQVFHLYQILEEINSQEDYPMNEITMFLIKKILAYFDLDVATLKNYQRIYQFEMLLQRKQLERELKQKMREAMF